MTVPIQPPSPPHPATAALPGAIRQRYALDWLGLRGAPHSARVLENGLHLCAATPGLREDRVVLFALLHDSRREDDDADPGHGERAADFAASLHARGRLAIDEVGLELLVLACRTHTGGRIPAHPTVMACWDSDRLDLPRISGLRVRADWLGTPAARHPDTVAAATRRAEQGAFPRRELFLQAW